MKIGIVQGAFAPITKSDWNEIINWKKVNHFRKVIIVPIGDSEISVFDRIKMIKQLTDNYRHLSVAYNYQVDDTCVILNIESKPWDFMMAKLFPVTRKYLLDHELFIEEIAKQYVSDKRWVHVKSMTKLAIELATIYNVDLHITRLAGLFHDCTKNWNQETTYSCMRFSHPDFLDRPFAILHQYTAVTYLKRVLRVTDKEVLRAVGNHVLGDDTSLLGKIIYIADKLDPSRGYDSKKDIEICKSNLDYGFRIVKQQQEEYVAREGIEK